MKFSSEKGNISVTALTAITVLSLSSMYIKNSSDSLNQRTKQLGVSNRSILLQNNNLSNLSVLRSAMSSAKLGGSIHEPAIFPTDYFASSWNLLPNPFSNTTLTTNGTSVTIKGFSDKELSPSELNELFLGHKTMASAALMANTESLQVVGMVRDSLNKYYVKAVDVKATTKATVDHPTTVMIGRIDLPAPLPGTSILKIKPETGGSFTTNFGTQSNPLPSGKYVLEVWADGVVHHAKVWNDSGWSNIVGINTDNQITHFANNIHSTLTPLGDTELIFLGTNVLGAATVINTTNTIAAGNAQKVEQPTCSAFIVEPIVSVAGGGGGSGTTTTTTASQSSAAAKTTYHVDLIGVDGQQHTTTLDQPMWITVTTTTTLVTNITTVGGNNSVDSSNNCRNSCTAMTTDQEYQTNYWGFLDHSYFGGLDQTIPKNTLDTFEPGQTAEVQRLGGKGSYCANNELVAQKIVSSLGISKPSDVDVNNLWTQFAAVVGPAKDLEQYYVYMEPACQRQYVSQRNGCGCFEESTQILMANGSLRKASQIRRGDILWNPMTQRGAVVRDVVAGPEVLPLYTIKLGSTEIKVTEGHPFLTSKGLKQAKELMAGDSVLDGGTATPITSITRDIRSANTPDPEVWNFELEGSSSDDDHYVVANGIMTGDLYLQKKLGKAKIEKVETTHEDTKQ
ncbi:MAG: hypothetical protein H7249_07460 [Chitinophagaceae bacterium]|nr:hypothetical protein [Oligoflexus sp.]